MDKYTFEEEKIHFGQNLIERVGQGRVGQNDQEKYTFKKYEFDKYTSDRKRMCKILTPFEIEYKFKYKIQAGIPHNLLRCNQ